MLPADKKMVPSLFQHCWEGEGGTGRGAERFPCKAKQNLNHKVHLLLAQLYSLFKELKNGFI